MPYRLTRKELKIIEETKRQALENNDQEPENKKGRGWISILALIFMIVVFAMAAKFIISL